MDRERLPPRSSSASTNPTSRVLPTAPLPSQGAVATVPGQQLRRGISDGVSVTTSTLQRLSGSGRRPESALSVSQLGTSTADETWRSFLRVTGEATGFPFGSDSGGSGHVTDRSRLEPTRRINSITQLQSTDATVSLARKRITSLSDGGSTGKRRSTGGGSGSSTPQGTASNPIDLTGAESSSRAPRGGNINRQPSSGSIVLPPWQQDEEVSNCPVCGTPFTIWYRRHHCRKCGRVVCGSCSPHRITIPRQFIVSPPPYISASPFARLGISPDDGRATSFQQDTQGNSLSRRSSQTVGGGEIVRVCNPCVPDPNFSPPPQMPQIQSSVPGFALGSNPSSAVPAGVSVRSSFVPARRSSAITTSSGVPLPLGSQHPPSHSYQYLPARLQMHSATVASSSTAPSIPSLTTPRPVEIAGISSAHRQYYLSNLTTTRPPNQRPPSNLETPSITAPQQVPVRQIKEEDECPVCGRELPPKGAGGEESAREQHIEDCIRLYSASSSSVPPPVPPVRASPAANFATSSAMPVQNSVSTSSTSIGQSPATAIDTSASPSKQSVPLRPSQHRMLLYHATEKDCVGEDGDRQECVICFEEFEEGDEMGRLDCLCKFHRACIRQWWGTKGVGSCPTHQLHQ